MGTRTVLVTGATGATGSALVPRLVERGLEVRAMVRDAAREVPGATTAVADLDDAASTARALDGVDAVYLTCPSSERAAERQMRAVDLAVRAGVGRIVVLSQYAAAADSPVRFLRWHAEVEAHLAARDVAHTVLRPNLFLQSVAAVAAAGGSLVAPIGDARISAIDLRDIADVAAVELAAEDAGTRTHTLTGPRAISHREIATALGDASGVAVGFLDVTPDAFAAGLAGLLPPWQAAGVIEDYAHYARGEAAAVSSAVEAVTGHPARDVTTFARDHAAVAA